MNDNMLKNILAEEHKNVEAPAGLKYKVWNSIDSLLTLKALVELYGNIPLVVIQSLGIRKEKRGIINKFN